MLSGGIDLATSALSPHESVWHAIPFFVLAALVVAAAIWQQRIALRRSEAPAQSPALRFMPALTGFFALSLPAGVTLYYLVSSLFRVGQQHLITRHAAELSTAP